MNQQESRRAVIVSGLRTGQTVKEIMNFANIKKRRCGVKEVWPPSSPDCNPLDYSVWGVTELKVNAAAHNKTKDLTKKIKELMGSFDRDIVARTSRRFCSWTEAVVAADGNFIK
jgi:hypothetical protein